MNEWEILGRYPSSHPGQFKIIAKRGAQVVHMDRLTPEECDEVTSDRIAQYWEACKR